MPTIAELSFDQQVVIWSLRTCFHHRDGALRVRRQFQRAMPPAAARIASDSLVLVAAMLRQDAVRPLALHTLRRERISRDERIVLALLHAVMRGGPSTLRHCAASLVAESSVEPFITAMASLQAALECRHSGAAPATMPRFVSTMVH